MVDAVDAIRTWLMPNGILRADGSLGEGLAALVRIRAGVSGAGWGYGVLALTAATCRFGQHQCPQLKYRMAEESNGCMPIE